LLEKGRLVPAVQFDGKNMPGIQPFTVGRHKGKREKGGSLAVEEIKNFRDVEVLKPGHLACV
jgi:hypothetical protein